MGVREEVTSLILVGLLMGQRMMPRVAAAVAASSASSALNSKGLCFQTDPDVEVAGSRSERARATSLAMASFLRADS
jgi:hypothetical protein